MENLAIVVPMFVVPFSVLMIYGATWPSAVDNSFSTDQPAKNNLVPFASRENGQFSYP